MIVKTEKHRSSSKANLLVAARIACAAVAIFAASALHAATGYAIQSDGDRQLYRINLSTGAASAIGNSTFNKIEAIALNTSGELYGVNPSSAELVKCALDTGKCTSVGALSGVPPAQTSVGLAFTASGTLYMTMSAIVYSVNPSNAKTTPLGSSGAAIAGLANGKTTAACASGLYAIGGNADQGKFYCINTSTGAATLLASISSPIALDGGLDGDFGTGLVWGITNSAAAQVYAVDPSVSPIVASRVRAVTVNGAPAGGFESLAVSRTIVSGPIEDNHLREVPTLGTAGLFALFVLLSAIGWRSTRRTS
jgi:hypothetical protein